MWLEGLAAAHQTQLADPIAAWLHLDFAEMAAGKMAVT